VGAEKQKLAAKVAVQAALDEVRVLNAALTLAGPFRAASVRSEAETEAICLS
jgi:hypothetical protein